VATSIVYFGPKLYDNLGYVWLLVNNDMLYYFPFVPTLILFVELLNLSRQHSITQSD
jgi:hypothetical protein